MKYVPATQEENLAGDRQRVQLLAYLLSQTDSKSITTTISEIQDAAKNNPYIQADVWSDGKVIFSLVEDFNPEYLGISWVGIPEVENLVPHG